MALSAKERKHQQLKREQAQLRALSDSSYEYLQVPFHVHLEADPNWSSVTLPLEMAGIEPPVFEDDRGPEAYAFEECFATDEDRDEAFGGAAKSIGRAEVMIGLLIDAATELAHIVNKYKRAELDKRLKEIEATDLSDPEERKAVLEQVVHIEKIKGALSKNVRRSLPQWEAKGV